MIDVNIVLENGATLPSYAKSGDAGVDLYPKNDYSIAPGARGILIQTGIKIELQEGYELQVRPKSGNSMKTPIRVVFGTVDSGYRGEIGVIIDNISDKWIELKRDKAIAQGVLNHVPKIKFKIVEKLAESDRGQGGFGSTKRGI